MFFFANKNDDDFKDLNELASLQNRVKLVRLQEKLEKQSFRDDMKKIFEPVTKSIKDTSKDVTKTMILTPKENKKALENLNNIFLKIMDDRGILASYLMSLLPNPEATTQFKLVKISNSNRVNELLIHNTKPITLYDKFLMFRDTGKIFELKGELLK